MSTRDQERAALDLGIVLVVFTAVSLTVPMLNPPLRRGYGLGSGRFLIPPIALIETRTTLV